MKHSVLTVILLILAIAFALEGTCGIGLRELTAPLASREMILTVTEDHPATAPDLPFDITLKSFDISPKQFTSTIEIDGKVYVTSVNHPCRHGRWSIYQYDYDESEERYSVLKIVERSIGGWIAAIAALLAAIGFLIRECRPIGGRALAAAVILTAGITAATLAGISLKALPPALRSPFFLPHILIYMVAYALLTVSLFTRKSAGAASALLLTGLLLGSVWAKLAWGEFWQWDVKECWAAATWLLSAAACLQAKKGSRKGFLLLAILAFLAMNMTWYGVNWLPEAASSLHAY